MNERLITAIKRNLISYLSSYFITYPHHINAFFYHESSKPDVGLFSTLIYAPAKFILTPLSVAVMYNSLKSLEYLLKLGSNPNESGLIVDCPIEEKYMRWKVDLYRLHEVFPVCLTDPNSNVFQCLVSYGLHTSIDFKLRFRLVTLQETKERSELAHGLWELAWIFWVNMRSPDNLIKTTDNLIVSGMSSTYVMERVNLLPMMKKIYSTNTDAAVTLEEATFIIDLMKILLWSGCEFDKTKMIDYLYPCVQVFFYDVGLLNSSLTAILHRYKILQGIANQSRKFRKILADRGVLSRNLAYINNRKFSSLEMAAIVVVRRNLTGVFFNKKLSVLHIDVKLKEVIQNCIPNTQSTQFTPRSDDKQINIMFSEEDKEKLTKSFVMTPKDSTDDNDSLAKTDNRTESPGTFIEEALDSPKLPNKVDVEDTSMDMRENEKVLKEGVVRIRRNASSESIEDFQQVKSKFLNVDASDIKKYTDDESNKNIETVEKSDKL